MALFLRQPLNLKEGGFHGRFLAEASLEGGT